MSIGVFACTEFIYYQICRENLFIFMNVEKNLFIFRHSKDGVQVLKICTVLGNILPSFKKVIVLISLCMSMLCVCSLLCLPFRFHIEVNWAVYDSFQCRGDGQNYRGPCWYYVALRPKKSWNSVAAVALQTKLFYCYIFSRYFHICCRGVRSKWKQGCKLVGCDDQVKYCHTKNTFNISNQIVQIRHEFCC